jgi:hypothetical protein
MRTIVTILIVLALVSGGAVTLISSLRSTTVDEPITMFPGVTLSPQDLKNMGLGTAVFADSSGGELAGTKSGITIDFRGGGSVTFRGGQFSQYSSPVVRDQAYAWYRDQAASMGLVDDKGTAIVGDASARYSDPDAAALLVRKNETVFTLLYTLSTAATNSTPRPIIALEALARLLASRF